MRVTLQELIDTLERRKPIAGWPPEIPPRALRSFLDIPDLSMQEAEELSQSDSPADQLRALGAWYRHEEYKRIRTFFKGREDKLGNEGMLLLVLAYLRLLGDKPERLSTHAMPVVKTLVTEEPSEFGSLYEWFQNFILERPMPQRFYDQSAGCKL